MQELRFMLKLLGNGTNQDMSKCFRVQTMTLVRFPQEASSATR